MTSNSFSTVAIAGCGAICAVGSGVEALKLALRGNVSGLHPSKRFDHPRYQSNIVGAVEPNGAGADQDDPACSLATEALRQARDEARVVQSADGLHRVGKLIGDK